MINVRKIQTFRLFNHLNLLQLESLAFSVAKPSTSFSFTKIVTNFRAFNVWHGLVQMWTFWKNFFSSSAKPNTHFPHVSTHDYVTMLYILHSINLAEILRQNFNAEMHEFNFHILYSIVESFCLWNYQYWWIFLGFVELFSFSCCE